MLPPAAAARRASAAGGSARRARAGPSPGPVGIHLTHHTYREPDHEDEYDRKGEARGIPCRENERIVVHLAAKGPQPDPGDPVDEHRHQHPQVFRIGVAPVDLRAVEVEPEYERRDVAGGETT